MATARVGDKLRALGGQKREDIADALFNNAYSALMTVGTLSGGTHLQMAYDQLRADPLLAFEMWAACKLRWQDKLGIPAATVAKILASKPAISLPGGTDEGKEPKTIEEQAKTQDERVKATPPSTAGNNTGRGGTEIPVKEEIDWDARDDEEVTTPPFLDEEAQQPGGWQDIPGPEGTRQPVTPELLVDLDEASGDQQPSGDPAYVAQCSYLCNDPPQHDRDGHPEGMGDARFSQYFRSLSPRQRGARGVRKQRPGSMCGGRTTT